MKTTHDQPINVTLIGVEIRLHAVAHANTGGRVQHRCSEHSDKPTLSIPSKISTVVGLACKKKTEMHVQSVWPEQQCSATKQHYTIPRELPISSLHRFCVFSCGTNHSVDACVPIFQPRVIPSRTPASGEMNPRPTNTVYRTQFTFISAVR